ncbi:GNAT family N-acetyltransferase [Mucilaginibacter angelicae]|uniref:GNAT family N-acetyltransferase n=1 Tax=Mucilaginibacter angelicae TaxID=869718 RepID=A0ABV6L1D9_9SPHI
MLQPVSLENDRLYIHPFRSEDFNRYEKMVTDIYQILSDDDTLHFIPEKRLGSMADADTWLKSTILNFHCGHNFVHFITEKVSGKLLGIIDIISPQIVRAHYRLEQYPYFIEFYLSGKARGRKIMTTLLPEIIAELRQRNIRVLGAVVNKKNHAAQKVLLTAGFIYQSPFDPVQDLYQLSFSSTEKKLNKVG